MGKGVLTAPEGAAIPDEARAGLLADAGLTREGATLHLGGVPLEEIAARVGTPAYVYNAEAIRERYRLLDAALAALPHRICYAVKANSNLAVLRVLRDLGAGADIVSAGELQRALAAGFDPAAIVFSGVGKTVEELEQAVHAGVGHIHLESAHELDLLAGVLERLERSVSVGIRVNPDVTADTHPYISTGQGGIKFGVPFDQVVDLALTASRTSRIRFESIAMHLGSQILDPVPYRAGLERLATLIAQLRAAGITSLRDLDIGGGLGIRYSNEVPLAPDRLADAILPLARETGLAVVLEPGRYLVGAAGVLLTTVLSRKHSGGKEFVLVDAGMNDLVRPSHYGAYHDIVELEAAGRPEGRVDVVGPVCETGDFLALDRVLPTVESGERLAVLGAGAYGFVMSSNYNARPRAAEVLVDGGRWGVVRPREQVASLMDGESATPDWIS